MANPALHPALFGAGPNARPGWRDVPELEQLIARWVCALLTKGCASIELIQMLALNEVTYVPWGEWHYPTVFRKSVRDVVQFVSPVFWNVRIA